MYKYVVLGNSLTANLICVALKNSNTLLVDYARRSSILYGHDAVLRGKSCCIDAVPILLNDNDVVEISNSVSINLRVSKVSINIELIGTEEGYTNKVNSGFIPQINWFNEIINGKLFINDGFCRLFRFLDLKFRSKIFGEIKKVEMISKKVKVLDREITYDKLIITYPLDYVLKKLGNIANNIREVSSRLNFKSILSTLILVRNKLYNTNNEIKIVKVGKKGFLTTLIVLISGGFYKDLSKLVNGDCTIVYALSPISIKELRGELDRLVLNELRRLINLHTNDVIMYRQMFIKYGLIGTLSYDEIRELEDYLKLHDIYLVGRTAKWHDMRLSEVIREVRNFIFQLS